MPVTTQFRQTMFSGPACLALASPADKARALACPIRRRGGGGIRGCRHAKYSVVMPDIKPPRLAGSEAETLHALLHYQRDSLVARSPAWMTPRRDGRRSAPVLT